MLGAAEFGISLLPPDAVAPAANTAAAAAVEAAPVTAPAPPAAAAAAVASSGVHVSDSAEQKARWGSKRAWRWAILAACSSGVSGGMSLGVDVVGKMDLWLLQTENNDKDAWSSSAMELYRAGR